MYQPWHKRRSVPPYYPYLATSSKSPNNKVNANYNSQWSRKGHFATSSGQIWQIDKAVHTTTSSSEWRQERLGSRKCPSLWGIVQHAIQKEACGQVTKRNAILMQWRERIMDRGLCWERNRWGKKASWRRRGPIQQVQTESTKAENVGSWNREPTKTFQGIIVAIRDSLSDLASSDDEQDGEDADDEETVQGKLS